MPIMKFIFVFFGLFALAMCQEKCEDISPNCQLDDDCLKDDIGENCVKTCNLCEESVVNSNKEER